MISTVIYDSTAQTYTPFTTQSNEELAIRYFKSQSLSNKMILLNPLDFTLFKVAEFDEHSGEYTPCVPKKLCNANDFKEVFNSGKD